jgi:hypothetical protein
MALSRDGSRDGVSDMGKAVHDRELLFIAELMGRRRGKINPGRGHGRKAP